MNQVVAGDRGRCYQATKPALDAPRNQNDYRPTQQQSNCQPQVGMNSCKHSLPTKRGRVTGEACHRLSPRFTMMVMHADNCFHAGLYWLKHYLINFLIWLGILFLFSQADAVMSVNEVYWLGTTHANVYAALEVYPLWHWSRLHEEVHLPNKPEPLTANSNRYVEV